MNGRRRLIAHLLVVVNNVWLFLKFKRIYKITTRAMHAAAGPLSHSRVRAHILAQTCDDLAAGPWHFC